MSEKRRWEPEIGAVFEDGYVGENHRWLRVIAVAAPDSKGRPRFTCETVRNDGRPLLVGKRSVVGAHTLRLSFRVVSAAEAAEVAGASDVPAAAEGAGR